MNQALEVEIKKRSLKYYLLFLWPLLALITVFIINTLGGLFIFPTDPLRTIWRSIFAFLGVVCIIIAIFLLIWGIIFAQIFKSRSKKLFSDPKYQNLLPEQIIYLAEYSFAPLFGSLIFALGNRFYLYGSIIALSGILNFIHRLFFPKSVVLTVINTIIGIPVIIITLVLIFQNRLSAWEKFQWSSFEAFKKRQKVISWLIVLSIIVICVSVVLVGYINVIKIK